jgi:hypothetical protein
MKIEDALYQALQGIGWGVKEDHPEGNHGSYE